MNSRQVEILEILDGSRSRQRRKAALRLEDVLALLEMPQARAASAAGAAPTAAEFDVLLADVKAIRQSLDVIATALQRRLLP